MKVLAVATALVAVLAGGCATAGTSTSPALPSSSIAVSSGRTPGPGDATWNFIIEEVGVGDVAYVTLKNFTELRSSPGALFLCQANSCVDLPDMDVEPGELIRIAVGDGAGLEKVVLTSADLNLPPADGEVAIYASTAVRDSTAMRYYMQWGSTPHALTDVAVTAHLYGTTTYSPSGPNATRLWKNAGGVWVWDASN